jgi:hypothetical protein
LTGRPYDLEVRVRVPENLTEFTLNYGYLDFALHPLFTASHLVILNIWGPLDGIDYPLIRQAVRASSRTVRVLALSNLDDELGLVFSGMSFERIYREGRLITETLTSCTSVRFLQLGFPILHSMPIRELFGLLARLPIELLCLEPTNSIRNFYRDMSDNLHLLPKLKMLMIDLKEPHVRLLKSKYGNLLVEGLGDHVLWPPVYSMLSPEAKALFKDRPYRTTCLSSIFGGP